MPLVLNQMAYVFQAVARGSHLDWHLQIHCVGRIQVQIFKVRNPEWGSFMIKSTGCNSRFISFLVRQAITMAPRSCSCIPRYSETYRTYNADILIACAAHLYAVGRSMYLFHLVSFHWNPVFRQEHLSCQGALIVLRPFGFRSSCSTPEQLTLGGRSTPFQEHL